MNFNSHSALKDKHSFLSPSGYHWINYDLQKLEARYHSARSAALGTSLHNYAQSAINLGIRQSEEPKTINLYINDCLDYGMHPEQTLFYSYNCFGTADAIVFNDGILRVFDLKTGVSPTSVHQLEVYAAIFCLEYSVDPFAIEYDLRIYQSNEVQCYIGDPEIINAIMDKIVEFDLYLENLKGADNNV